MEHKIIEFNPTIYPRLLWVVTGKDSAKWLSEAFEGPNGEFLDLDAINAGARASTWARVRRKDTNKLGALVCLVDKYNDVEVAAHEAVHVANGIFYDLDIQLEFTADEHYAHFVGWVANCIWKVASGKVKEK